VRICLITEVRHETNEEVDKWVDPLRKRYKA
jgi:hypothetical protein